MHVIFRVYGLASEYFFLQPCGCFLFSRNYGKLGHHMHPREIAKELEISQSSERSIIKTKSIKQLNA